MPAFIDIECSTQGEQRPPSKGRFLRLVKGFLLASIVVFTVTVFVMVPETQEKWDNVVSTLDSPAYLELPNTVKFKRPIWTVKARGQFIDSDLVNETSHAVRFSIIRLDKGQETARMDDIWVVQLAQQNMTSGIIEPGKFATIELTKQFMKSMATDPKFHFNEDFTFVVEVATNETNPVPISLSISTFSELSNQGLTMAACILVLLYVLIIFEIIDRTLASMIGATAAVACLTMIGNRPSLGKLITWMDLETLCLLFGMMIMVGVLSETGFFDYIAVSAYRLAKGHVWPMIVILCIFTAVLSAFLDNVTTILLMTPVSIKLCEIKNIDPKHVLIAQVLFSNIGGAATPIGDPPNVIIINSLIAKSQNVDFAHFTMHVSPGALIAAVVALLVFRYLYRDVTKFNFLESPEVIVGRDMVMNFLKEQVEDMDRETAEAEACSHRAERGSFSSTSSDESTPLLTLSPSTTRTKYSCPNDANDAPGFTNIALHSPNSILDKAMSEGNNLVQTTDLKEEIHVWKQAHDSLGVSKDEQTVRRVLQTKVVALESQLRKKLKEKPPQNDQFKENLMVLEKKYKIKNKELLIKAGVVMIIVIILFFMQSVPFMHLSLGWIALLGAICLLVLADIEDMESVFNKVEWPTLVFFACLFVVMEALRELHLLEWVGHLTQEAIASFSPNWQLFMAINIVLWVSALASSFIDNIPFATVVVKILEDMSHSDSLHVPMAPLVYALAFGACLGGNGTLIGASANVVCAGVAEHQGYKITFVDFFKVGFPIMLATVASANLYLILCHIIFNWH